MKAMRKTSMASRIKRALATSSGDSRMIRILPLTANSDPPTPA
jgi:hypothetical protein